MSAIYFQLNPLQEKELRRYMEDEGYTSKAEFFRFLLKFFKYTKSNFDEKPWQKSARELGDVLKRLNRQDKLSKLKSLDELLKEV